MLARLNLVKIFITCLIVHLFFIQQITILNAQQLPLTNVKPDLSSVSSREAADYIGFYQKYISDLRGVDCPMEPSCSNYALESISKYGFIKGVANGMDRLVRCGHEHQFYNTTFTKRGIKLIDSNYDSLNLNNAYKREVKFYPPANYSTEPQFDLIIKLINQRLYHEALLEVNRLKQTYENNITLIGYELLCLNAIEFYDQTIWVYETKLSQVQKKEPELLRQYFTAYYKMRNYRKVISAMEELGVNYNDPNIGYIHTLAFNSLLKEKELSKARSYLAENSNYFTNKGKYETVLDDVSRLKRKSPFISGISSVIIPGSGYIYSGHTKTGISSLLFNSLFAFATYSNFKSGNPGMGLLTGLFGLAFYISNIQGAVKSTHRYNDMNYQNIINRFEEQTIIYH